jgi:myo-inositol-1(or 4)-monophosphatase
LAYTAAGFNDGFFESNLLPWDVAAGSLLVTEAGGLVGNFTGEADFLEQGECLAGNPRIYAQLVTTLAKYSKFAGAGDKANVRQALQDEATEAAAEAIDAAEPTDGAAPADKPKTLQGRKSQASSKASSATDSLPDAPF